MTTGTARANPALVCAAIVALGLPVHGVLIHSCEDSGTAAIADDDTRGKAKLELATDPAHVSEGRGSLRLWSVSPAEDKVVYISVDLQIPPVDLKGKALLLDAWTSDPPVTRAFYVRGYNKQGGCVLSWMSWAGPLGQRKTEFLLIPGANSSGMKWEPYKITSEDLSALTRLRLYVGTKVRASTFDLYVDDIRAVDAASMTKALLATGNAMAVVDRARFTDHGVGAAIAELRGVVAAQTADGRSLVIATATDQGETGYVLVTDVDSGRTRQVHCPAGVRQHDPFGGLLSAAGKFYHTQGKVLLELDPATLEWTFQGTPSKTASVYLCFTEGPDGTVWAGSVYQTTLVSFDPGKRETRDHGRMDPEEKYLQHLATDASGWVYAGIGTARCNLIAYNPATGEKRSLAPEADRVHGSGHVFPGNDGAAYGTAAGKHYRLLGGEATPITAKERPPRRRVLDIKYGGRIRDLPDGRQIVRYDLEDRTVQVREAKTKRIRTLSFTYETEGAFITSLAAGPGGMVYGSTCHPMHFLALDTGTGTPTDMGFIPQVGGGNFCAIAVQGNQVIGAEYAGGRLWAYDVTKPWQTGRKRVSLAQTPGELIESGRMRQGRFAYLPSHHIVFMHGDDWDAAATFPLSAPAPGAYRLYVAPYRHSNYCTVEFSFDGKVLGRPYAANSASTGPGEVLVFGPMDLKAGQHTLTVRTLETEGAKPFFGLCGVELTQEQRDLTNSALDPNPRILAQWKRDICRPRTALAHPDGKHVMMAGFAGYGLCGGGIGIYNLDTGEAQLLTADADLLPGHSPTTLKALPNGDLVGGTSIEAPGGGHPTAREAELFILDWKSRKMVFRTVPVPGDARVSSIQVHGNGKVFGLCASATLFVFDPATRKVVFSQDLRGSGGVPRHALLLGPKGKLYAMLGDAILSICPTTFEHRALSRTPVRVTAGGACVNGRLWFAGRSHVWSYRIPSLPPPGR